MSTHNAKLDLALETIIKQGKKSNNRVQKNNNQTKGNQAKGGQNRGNQGRGNQGRGNQGGVQSRGNQNRGNQGKGVRNDRGQARGNAVRNNRTPATKTARLSNQRDATTRIGRAARSQTISKARGMQSLALKSGIRKRATVARTYVANTIVRRNLLRSRQQGLGRPRIGQRSQQVKANNTNNNNNSAQARNLRITVSNRLGGQGTRGGGLLANRLRGRNTPRAQQSPVRSRTTLATRSPLRLRPMQRAPLGRSNQRTPLTRSNLRRAPTQNAQQRQLESRLSRARQNNQARQANVVAQRRGIVPQQRNNNNNNNNNNRNGGARSTLNARFSQQRSFTQNGSQGRTVIRTNGQGNRNRGGNQRSNNGQVRRQRW